MSRWTVGAVVAVFSVAVMLAMAWRSRDSGNGFQSREAAFKAGADAAEPGGALPVLWTAPTFSYRDQDGMPQTDQSLRGRVWVANFIFTQCTSVCPTMTAKMTLLQRRVRNPDLRFISFSVDPEHDTPAVLKAYAALWHGDEARWRLLSTDRAGIAKTAAAMKVSVQRDNDADHTIIHSTTFLLVDAKGNVRGVYNSNDEASMDKLAADAASLAGAAGGAAEQAATTASPHAASAPVASEGGEAMFLTLGCAACHNQAKLAPSLRGLAEGVVRLDTGATLTADEAYLRESIVDPGAKIVAGYGRTMPNYKPYLSQSQVGLLVEYIKSLRASSMMTQGTEVRKNAVDPVCEMSVSVDGDTPHAAYKNSEYYFCCEACRDRFVKSPQAYLSSDQTRPTLPPMH